MGFLDRDVRNGLDAMFDIDRDGVINPFERALELEFMAGGSGDADDEDEDDFDEYDDFDEDDDF